MFTQILTCFFTEVLLSPLKAFIGGVALPLQLQKNQQCYDSNLPMFIEQCLCCVAPRGKIKRIAFQFTPYSWVKFEWKPASTVRRWLAVLGIIFMVRIIHNGNQE